MIMKESCKVRIKPAETIDNIDFTLSIFEYELGIDILIVALKL